jgi:hypothetical protein
MRIMTGGAADPLVVGITFALEDAIRLKAHIVQPIQSRLGKYLLGAPVTRAAEFLREIIPTQPRRVENLIFAR